MFRQLKRGKNIALFITRRFGQFSAPAVDIASPKSTPGAFSRRTAVCAGVDLLIPPCAYSKYTYFRDD
jgi:hypothetical protein